MPEERKQEWTNSLRQLWTSPHTTPQKSALQQVGESSLFHAIQTLDEDVHQLSDNRIIPIAELSSALRRECAMIAPAVSDADAKEVRGGCLSEGLREKLKHYVEAPSFSSETSSASATTTRNLIECILLLDKQRRYLSDAAVDPFTAAGRTVNWSPHNSLQTVVSEILTRLVGSVTPPQPSPPGRKEDAANTIEDGLYRVLLEVERCQELAQHALQSNAAAESTPKAPPPCLKETLLIGVREFALRRGTRPNESYRSGGGLQEDVLQEIADILCASGVTQHALSSNTGGSDQVSSIEELPEALMRLVRETENLRRNYQFIQVVLKQYEDTVKRRLAMYGECDPPLAAAERKKLSSGSAAIAANTEAAAPTSPTWLEGSLQRLEKSLQLLEGRGMKQMDAALPTTTSFMADATDAATLQASMRQILERAGAALVTVASEDESTRHRKHITTAIDAAVRAVLAEVLHTFPASQRERVNPDVAGVISAVQELAAQERRATDRVQSLCQRLRSSFHLPSREEGGTAVEDQLSFLEDAVAAVCRRSAEAVSSEYSLQHRVDEAIDALAQLLVFPSDGDRVGRVEVPPMDLLEMVQLVRAQFTTAQAQQRHQQFAGNQSRCVKSKLEDIVRQFIGAARPITADALRAADGMSPAEETPTPTGSLATDGLLSGAKDPTTTTEIEEAMAAILQRLRLIKTKSIRAGQLRSSQQSRIDHLTQQGNSQQKRMRKVAASLDRICAALGIDRDALLKETQSATAVVTESNVLEAVTALERRLVTDKEMVEQCVASGELEALRREARHWREDTQTFREAMVMVLTRLAESGRLMKRSLYMLGTDESAVDDLVNDVLREQENSEKEKEARSLRDNSKEAAAEEESDGADGSASERALALLLQKYARWTQRLHEAVDDHLYTQKKIVKYFTAVRRFFGEGDGERKKERGEEEGGEAVDENLIDIDTALMQSADVILPALDRAIREAAAAAVDGKSPSNNGSTAPPMDVPTATTAQPVPLPSPRRDAVSHLAASLSADGGGSILHYDHRLGRLHDLIGKLHTLVTSLQRVRYLSIPVSVRQRSSGETELTFDDDVADGDGFVALELDMLQKVSIGAAVEAAVASSVPPPQERFSRDNEVATSRPSSTVSPLENTAIASSQLVTANNDIIMRVATQNLEVLHDSLRRFSSSHKLAAIMVQKDMDGVQQHLATMLERFSELDVEQAFGQDRQALRELHTCLSERSTRQRGCYFFNRPDGEGPCVWLNAVQPLSAAFGSIIDKLVDCTKAVSHYRSVLNELTDLGAMYVTWAERVKLPSEYPLPEVVRVSIVRDGSVESDATSSIDGEDRASLTPGRKKQQPYSTASLPPLPTTRAPGSATPTNHQSQQQQPPSPEQPPQPLKVSHFRDEGTLARVVTHMFQLAQVAVACSPSPKKAVEEIEDDGKGGATSSQMQSLQDAVQRAEALASTLERERNQAQSEAAVAKAELRRWRRQQAKEQSTPARSVSPITPERPSNSRPPLGTTMNGDCLQEMLEYMKALSDELHYANAIAEQERRAAPVAGAGAEEPSWNTLGKPSDSPDGIVWSPPKEQPPLSSEAAHLQRNLQHQYGSTPLRVVADPSGGSYAGPSLKDRFRSTSNSSRRYRPGEYTGPVYESCDACVRHHRNTPGPLREVAGPPPPPSQLQHPEQLPQRSSSLVQERRQQRCTPSRSQHHSEEAVGTTPQRRSLLATRERRQSSGEYPRRVRHHRYDDEENRADPVEQRRGSGGPPEEEAWLQEDGRPSHRAVPVERRYKVGAPKGRSMDRMEERQRSAAGPSSHVSNRRQQPCLSARHPHAFKEALRTIAAAEQNFPASTRGGASDAQVAANSNANLRASALRRLAEVVSMTKIHSRPRGATF